MKGKVYALLFISNTCVVVAGLGPAGGDMSRQASVQAVQAQHGDQQGADVTRGGRKLVQVSMLHSRQNL